MREPDAVWSGWYYDGRTANRVEVSIAIRGDALHLAHAGARSSMVWPIALVRQSQGGEGRERLRLEYGSDPAESLVVEQPGLAEAMRALAPGANPSLRTRRGSLRLVTVLVAIAAVMVAAYVVGARPFARWLASKVPVEFERELAGATEETLAKRARGCTDSITVAAVRGIMDRLLAAAPGSPYAFTLLIERDTTVNAFAAPGGLVVVNGGLLAAAQSPEELAGVLSHEIQHVLQRHGLQSMIREIPVQIALAGMGSGSAGVDRAASIAGTLGALKYRRDHETEADVEGMKLLQAARVDARGAASFMRSLDSRASRGGDASRFATYLSSHPRSSDRARVLQAMADSATYEPRPLMDSATWRHVQRGCAPR